MKTASVSQAFVMVAAGAHYPFDRAALTAMIRTLPGLRLIPQESIPPPRVLAWDPGPPRLDVLPPLGPDTVLLLVVGEMEAEITCDAWERRDLSAATLELREALAAVETATDLVIVPVASTLTPYTGYLPVAPWRRTLVRTLDRLLRWGGRKASRPEVVNGVLFGAYCCTVCWLAERFWTADQRAAWEAQNRARVENIVQAVERDPGRRVLVAVQCQRLHRLRPWLKAYDELLEIVDYGEL